MGFGPLGCSTCFTDDSIIYLKRLDFNLISISFYFRWVLWTRLSHYRIEILHEMFWPVNLLPISTLGMKSRASVTVMVTWVCVKDSSNIQSGWREGKVNLRETDSSKVMSHQRSVFETPAFESFKKVLAGYLKRWNKVERTNSLWMAMPM